MFENNNTNYVKVKLCIDFKFIIIVQFIQYSILYNILTMSKCLSS